MNHERLHRWTTALLVPLVVGFVLVAVVAYGVAVIDPHDWVPRGPAAPLDAAPGRILASAQPGDVLETPLPLYYWGRQGAEYYGVAATRDKEYPVAVITHHTRQGPIMNFVHYQHNGDKRRGGHYGYHVYVDDQGTVVQGAPLSVRTNHIKPPSSPNRKGQHPKLSNENTVSVSLVGGCRSRAMTPCKKETITDQQREAAINAVVDLMRRFRIPCDQVFGHGELQHDRHSFEGVTVAKAVRDACEIL